ncbi:MAG: multicomponent Na+:H+ antiporter subunit G [Lentisphaeria bacterium]|jgi:multicomponent Na+:H+ antiporter subunit G
MDMVLSIGSQLCLLIGVFLCLSGGVGILRFPDFYTRMHAVGVTDTLAAGMILIGLMLQAPEILVLVKLIMILFMTLFINPSASHALAKAAMHHDIMPMLDKKGANKAGEVSSNP